MMNIIKYPRTRHLRGSRLQKGDEDLEIVSADGLVGRHVVVEEKQDGANTGISFDSSGKLHLQSRGHFLQGGPREKQFTLFKQWATTHADALREVLTNRYIAYGEWMYSKHTVFYDALTHYWMEFDVLDKTRTTPDRPVFLDTPSRRALLDGLPIQPVHVIWSGTVDRKTELPGMIGRSVFITSDHEESLRKSCRQSGQDYGRVAGETDMTGLMEGLYIKVESAGLVTDRFKLVRANFVSKITDSDEHHLNRPIVPNLLRDGVELF